MPCQSLDLGPQADRLLRVAQPLERAQRPGAIARRQPPVHHRPLRRLVGGLGLRELLPPPGGPQRAKVLRPQLVPPLGRPRREPVVGQQLAAVPLRVTRLLE